MWWDASAVYGNKEVCDGMPQGYMVTRRYVMGCLSGIWLQEGMWWDASALYGNKEICDGMSQLYIITRKYVTGCLRYMVTRKYVIGCLRYMVTRKYVIGCLSCIWLQGNMWWDAPAVYGYKEICDGMPQVYGYKEVCDGISPLIRIHYPSDRLYFHSSIAVIRRQSQRQPIVPGFYPPPVPVRSRPSDSTTPSVSL